MNLFARLCDVAVTVRSSASLHSVAKPTPRACRAKYYLIEAFWVNEQNAFSVFSFRLITSPPLLWLVSDVFPFYCFKINVINFLRKFRYDRIVRPFPNQIKTMSPGCGFSVTLLLSLKVLRRSGSRQILSESQCCPDSRHWITPAHKYSHHTTPSYPKPELVFCFVWVGGHLGSADFFSATNYFCVHFDSHFLDFECGKSPYRWSWINFEI